MKRFLSKELKRAYADLGRLSQLEEEDKLAEAREGFLELRAAARRAGIPHPMVSWRLAVLSDRLGELEAAMEWVVEALEQDPLAGPFRHSFDIIARRIRDTITADDWDVADPATARLYDLLVRENEATDEAHLAMARHLVAVGETARAKRLLDALTVVAPRMAEAWMARARVARAEGDEATATACEVEAAACGAGGPPVFGIPGRADG